MIEEFARGEMRSVARMASALRTMAPYAEREQTLCAERLAYELAKLF